MDRSALAPLTEAKGIAEAMPDMLIEARRVANVVLAGWHGRRASGRGETFWQFRPFVTGEAASGIDWRRSARDEHLFVREKEWEAAHTIWLWVDLSPSMDFRSRLAPVTKRHRATVLTLALAELLAVAGERIGLLGASDPILARNAAERIAAIIPRAAEAPARPDTRGAPPLLRRRADRRLPRSDRRDRRDAGRDPADRRPRPSRAGGRPDRGDIPLRRPDRVPRSGDRRSATSSRAPSNIATNITARLAALREHLRTLCRRLDWTFLDPPHRPAGDRAAARSARPPRRPPEQPRPSRRARRMTAFAFTNIGMLAALVALPVIWYFLRLMPPKPRLEQFPPTRLLLEIARKEEEQPARSPWWLTALRLLLAAAVILALAGPVFKPTGEVAPGDGPLLVVVDNGWASAPQWPAMVATAHRVVDLAAEANRPIALLATAEPANQPLAPTDSAEIAKRLDALAPRPWAPDYAALAPALAAAAKATPFGGVAWLSDGLGGDGVDAFADALAANVSGPLVAYADTGTDLFGLKPPVGAADALTAPVVRRAAAAPAAGIVRASDIKGRVIGDAPFAFAAGAATAEAKFTLPVELRNDIVRLEVAGADTAGAVQLLDDRWRRRRIGLLSGASVETAQPLLSPLYYISRAVQPFADVREPRDANAAVAIPELIEGGARSSSWPTSAT